MTKEQFEERNSFLNYEKKVLCEMFNKKRKEIIDELKRAEYLYCKNCKYKVGEKILISEGFYEGCYGKIENISPKIKNNKVIGFVVVGVPLNYPFLKKGPRCFIFEIFN